MKEKKSKKGLVVVLIVVALFVIWAFKDDNKERETYEVIAGFELLAENNFEKEETLALGYPTLLDIGGAECIPCKAMAHVLKELNEELMGKAIIKFIDYWKYPELAKQFQFKTIPTQFFYDKNGDLYTTNEGSISKEKVLKIFAEMGYNFDE